MKWAMQVKEKMKAAGLLALIIVVIAIGHISGRQNYTELDQSISSIYADRLLPATYIYQVSEHLYQKRLLHEEEAATGSSFAAEHRAHNKAIAALVRNYEKTYLTTEEKQQWKLFKTNLYNYLLLDNDTHAATERQELFAQTTNCLHHLSNIQVGEGTHLKQNSAAIINGTLIGSYLEVSLLLILGVMTIILLSASNNPRFPPVEKHWMN